MGTLLHRAVKRLWQSASLDTLATLLVIGSCCLTSWIMFQHYWGTRSAGVGGNEERRGSLTGALPPEPIQLADITMEGSDSARVVLIQFIDFQCPYCARFAQGTLPQVRESYVKDGRVALAFVHLPLESIHPFAKAAAESAECAGQQGRFQPMHDLMFAETERLAPLFSIPRARTLGLNLDEFKGCLGGWGGRRVAAGLRLAESLEIRSTPTLLVGQRDLEGLVRVTGRIDGAAEWRRLKLILDESIQQGGY